jgi:hypothetical protein
MGIKKGITTEIDMQANEDSLEKKILKRIPREVLGLSFLMGIAATFLFDVWSGFFVLAGGAISAINFIWLHQSLASALLKEKREALKISALVFGLRLILILAIFFIIIFFFSKKIIAFAAGFSTVVIVLLLEALIVMPKLKTWKS